MAKIRISGMCALWPWPWSYDLGSRHDLPLSHGQQLCEILSRSNMAVKSYGPDIDFVYKCTVTLALKIWPWVKSWHTLGSWRIIVWNIIQIQHDSGELWPGNTYYAMCALWPWPWRYDLGQGLGQGHDTPLGYGQQLCEILSRSNMAVRSYSPDTKFGYVCTVTLTLEVWPWVKVMTHLWVMDNNCVIYYPDPSWQGRVMTRTLILCISALWPWHWRYDLGLRSWHILGSWTTIVWNIIQIQHGSEELIPGHTYFVMCALWPWPWKYDLGSRSWQTLGSWTTIVWNIIQIHHGSQKL